ncbi:MAG: hypothetical protein LBR49_02085, partial [Tannerella sp.]|nr:hypothetical protein [Tannerella sp.]
MYEGGLSGSPFCFIIRIKQDSLMKYAYLFVFCAMSVTLVAQQDSVIPFEDAYKRTYVNTRTDGSRPVIDGRLDDDFWQTQGIWTERFVQVSPFERQPSESPTRAKLLYDDKYIYVGIWCKDNHPEKTIRFIGNRDDNNVGDL